MKVLQPPGWRRPKGYANGISTRGRLIFTAGVVGWDENEQFDSSGLPGQFERALRNIVTILAEDGAGPEHIVRMTCYVINVHSYRDHLGAVGDAWQRVMGRNFPTMALVEVRGLVEPAAEIEIEAIAVVPD